LSNASPFPIFKNTSSRVVIPTPYDLTPSDVSILSNSEKKFLNCDELSVGN